MICHERKFIFIHMCRCAGTSVEVFFRQDIDQLNRTGERHALPAQYRQYWSGYFTFTIARNPWDRVYSAFNYALQRDLRDTPLKQRLHGECNGDFKEFVRSVLADESLFAGSDDRLFWPQSRWLMENGLPLRFDSILRFETLERDANAIASSLHLEQFSLPCTNDSAHRDYRGAYDEKAAATVGRIYADDIALLGYRFD